MKILVKLHARAADLAGTGECAVEVADGASCADVKDALAASAPALAGLLASSVLATDSEYLHDSSPADSRLHFIPPVSGG